MCSFQEVVSPERAQWVTIPTRLSRLLSFCTFLTRQSQHDHSAIVEMKWNVNFLLTATVPSVVNYMMFLFDCRLSNYQWLALKT